MAYFVHFLIILSMVIYGITTVKYGVQLPTIDDIVDLNKTYINDNGNYNIQTFLKLNGRKFREDMRFQITTEYGMYGDLCDNDKLYNGKITQSWINDTVFIIHLTGKSENYLTDGFLCVSYVDRTSSENFNSSDLVKWLHLGDNSLVRTSGFNDILSSCKPEDTATSLTRDERHRRNLETPTSNYPVELYGIRLETSDNAADYNELGVPSLIVGSQAVFRLFGKGWTEDTIFVLTEKSLEKGNVCEYITGAKIPVDRSTMGYNTLTINISIPQPYGGNRSAPLFLCTKESNSATFIHLGKESYLEFETRERIIPIWAQVLIILVCLSFSCLFSGLNLGLLSLNQTDLKIISNTGTETERAYARAIIPVRRNGNYLLCSILLSNVLVNSIFTILLDDMSSGMVAIIGSTLAIVIMGEIVPQAVCSRHGLAIGAKTIYVTKFVMGLSAPLAWPISRLLDCALGEEILNVYTRDRLKELVTTEYNDLEKEEVNIISGALELSRKTVAEVMTNIEDVYMLSYDTILDFETVSEIMKSGYSRIPIYEGNRRNIVSLLYIKDLALIDPDDNTPLKTLSHFYQNSCYFVFEDTTLDVVFKQFKDGCKGHMAFVHRVNNEGEGDPFYETIGIVTLEDVIEELIQAEIVDETDVYTDNRSKQRRVERVLHKDFSMFAERNENQKVHVSPQLNLATFQFMSSTVDAFKPDNVSETVLMRLLKQDVIFHIKMKDKEKMKDDPSTIIYQQGKPADYFILILEGRVEVKVGRENLLFESGPFTFFGSQALIQNIGVAESPTNVAQPMGSLQSVNLESMLRYTFIPDYTVRAITEVVYLRIKRSFYLAAKKATLMERSKKVSNAGDHFDDEVEKLLHNLGNAHVHEDEDGKSHESRETSSYNPNHPTTYIDDSNRSSPVHHGFLNNGGVPLSLSPSRTPRNTDQYNQDEKIILLTNLKSDVSSLST